MSQKLIRSLYEQRLATWAATKSLQVAWQNIKFTPPPGAHLRAFLLPARTDSQDLAGTHRAYLGVFQVSIMAPHDLGPGAAETLADEIAALFPLNLRLTSSLTVQIVTPCSQGPSIPGDTHYVVPMSFGYRADTI